MSKSATKGMPPRAIPRPPLRPEPREASETLHVKDLIADPNQVRRHNPRNIGLIGDALQAVGAARSIVIDENNVVLAGNGTVEAAGERGFTRVVVVEGDGTELIAVRRRGLSDADKVRVALYDNRASDLADYDPALLKAVTAEHGIDRALFFTDAEFKTLVAKGGPKEGQTDPDDVPPERETAIVVGDLFRLGRHRLLCGDATNAADVARVLAGVVPVLMVTDPPYGVNYDPAWRARAGVNLNAKKLGVVTNDDVADWSAAWELFAGAVAYVWHAGLKAGIVAASLEANGLEIRAQIIWAKDRLVLSRGDYHWQHEPCWYAVRKGEAALRTADRTQTTLWPIPARDDSGHGHSTQKPVECMARAIRNHDAPTVYEPFAGSGSTLIAAEQLDRACFAIEIEPRYCQVAIDRWEAFTGLTAEKVTE